MCTVLAAGLGKAAREHTCGAVALGNKKLLMCVTILVLFSLISWSKCVGSFLLFLHLGILLYSQFVVTVVWTNLLYFKYI